VTATSTDSPPDSQAGSACAPDGGTAFALDDAWRLHPRVALRPERFGALAYDFGTRRLSFLKSRRLLDVVNCMDGRRTAREACALAGVDEDELPRYEQALSTLAGSGMLARAGGA
jgi:mycofactocin biosynthesis protein MftB